MCSFAQQQSYSDKIIMQFAQVNFDILICQTESTKSCFDCNVLFKSPKAEISFPNVQMLFFFSIPYAGDRLGTKIN